MGRVLERAKQLEQEGPRRKSLDPIETPAEVKEIAAQRTKLLAIAEKILFARAESITADGGSMWDSRRFFPAEELAVFDSLGWDRPKLAAEASRVVTVAMWQAKAGTSADREAAQNRLTTAEKVLAEEGRKLEAEILKLQGQLRGLQREQTTAAGEVERMSIAVESLKTYIPQSVADEWNKFMISIGPVRVAAVKAKAELDFLRRTVAIDLESDRGFTNLSAAELAMKSRGIVTREFPPGTGLSDRTNHEWFKVFDYRKFKDFKKQLESEIPAAEARVKETEAALAEALAESDRILRYYER